MKRKQKETNKWRKKIRYFVYILIWLNGTRMTRVPRCVCVLVILFSLRLNDSHLFHVVERRCSDCVASNCTGEWIFFLWLNRVLNSDTNVCVCVCRNTLLRCLLAVMGICDWQQTTTENTYQQYHNIDARPRHHRIKYDVRGCELRSLKKITFSKSVNAFSLFTHTHEYGLNALEYIYIYISSPIHTSTDCWKLASFDLLRSACIDFWMSLNLYYILWKCSLSSSSPSPTELANANWYKKTAQ